MQITVMCRQFCVLLVATGTLFLPMDRLHKKVRQANLWAHLKKYKSIKIRKTPISIFLITAKYRVLTRNTASSSQGGVESVYFKTQHLDNIADEKMEMIHGKDGTSRQQSQEVLQLQNLVEVEQSSRTESVENLRMLDSNPDQTPHETARNLEAAKILSKSIDLVFEGRPRVSAFPSISFEHQPNRLHRYKMTTNK